MLVFGGADTPFFPKKKPLQCFANHSSASGESWQLCGRGLWTTLVPKQFHCQQLHYLHLNASRSFNIWWIGWDALEWMVDSHTNGASDELMRKKSEGTNIHIKKIMKQHLSYHLHLCCFFLWRLTFKASHFKPVDPHKSPESSSTLVLWGLWVKLQLKEVQRDKKLHATCCCCQGPCSFCVKLLWGKDMNLGCKSPEIRSKLSVEVLAQQHLALKVKLHWLYLVLSKSHVPRCQHCVCSVSGPLRSQLLHPSCKHTTWCATAGCWCYCRTAKCFQRRSWVCWILEPNCHWRCPWTAGRCGHHPTSLGSRLGERRGRVPGQLHRLPCWWQQQHRGREEVEEGCPGDLRQVRCGCYHYSSHQRQRLHARLRRQAGPRWHRGPSR